MPTSSTGCRSRRSGFRATLDKVIAASPDRIALYSYAHVPHLFKPQRRIEIADLPAPEVKLGILALAIEKLGAAGYTYIGMDHFAKPTDELAVAQRERKLHRNFQGYSTKPDCDLLAFGISAIGKVGASYMQNVRTLDEYYERLDAQALPVLRGVELDADDLLRRDVIQKLMCDFDLDFAAIDAKHGIRFTEYFAPDLAALAPLAARRPRRGYVRGHPGDAARAAAGAHGRDAVRPLPARGARARAVLARHLTGGGCAAAPRGSPSVGRSALVLDLAHLRAALREGDLERRLEPDHPLGKAFDLRLLRLHRRRHPLHLVVHLDDSGERIPHLLRDAHHAALRFASRRAIRRFDAST